MILLSNKLTCFFQDQYADSLAVYFAEDPSRCPWEQGLFFISMFIYFFVFRLLKEAWKEEIKHVRHFGNLCFIWFVFAVISSLVRFIGKFKKAHMENKRWADTEKKKLEENVWICQSPVKLGPTLFPIFLFLFVFHRLFKWYWVYL